jgi:hypothetical protein
VWGLGHMSGFGAMRSVVAAGGARRGTGEARVESMLCLRSGHVGVDFKGLCWRSWRRSTQVSARTDRRAQCGQGYWCFKCAAPTC